MVTGYHKHATPAHQRIAEKGTIFRCVVGSTVHGISISDQDDRDEMGFCIEPPEYVIGLQQFEQYITRTQPEGHRSGPGDLDLTIYSARKWLQLALAGNPTILLPLFVPEEFILVNHPVVEELFAHPEIILSRQAGDRFLGYLARQRLSLLSREGKGRDVTRPELIEQFGFDTKFAGHMVRLGFQGAELMQTGKITLPVPEPMRAWIRDLRIGKHTQAEALDMALDFEDEIKHYMPNSPLPERPDREAADRWLIDTYQEVWHHLHHRGL
jgi:uncharacterized protein